MPDPTVFPARIAVLSGGVGGARFARGVRRWGERTGAQHGTPAPALTCIVNTGDDMWLHGLRICPDLDSVLYGLAGVNDTDRGWGRADESETVSEELRAYGVSDGWFTLGDRDLGTHIARTQLLREGLGLAEVTRRLAARWDLGAALLPATEHEVETRVRVAPDPARSAPEAAAPQSAGAPSSGETPRDLHFEEWWVRHRAALPAQRFVHAGAESATPSPGVLEAIRDADVILLAPSNPIVSIGAILAIPGIADAVRAAAAPVVGLSPIIGDAPVLGMAAQCLQTVGAEVSAAGVAELHGPRSRGGLLDGWLIDEEDADAVPRIEAADIRAAAVPLRMRTDDLTADMVRAALDLARG